MAGIPAVGIQDFQKVIERNCFYVDKTDFIKEWWENGDDVTLITRPRRFGKTLTMSMVEQFFSVKYAGCGNLFEQFSIWKEKAYRKLQGTYPVMNLSFASVKGKHFQEAYEDICRLIAREYRRYVYILDHECFLQADKNKFYKMLEADVSSGWISDSLNQLSEYLYDYYGKKVIILLDEYDAPMQEAYVNGYWNEWLDFTRGLFNAAFKSNPYLERAILTGVTRISKESVFSGLNNLEVITTTSNKYASVFGFTEQEVFNALEEFGLLEEKEKVKSWYDGFCFGSCRHIYNPWSVTKFLSEKKFQAYWANTSANKLVGELVRKGSTEIKQVTEDLLHGKNFWACIDEEIVFDELVQDDNAVWSLLLAGGYLKIVSCKEEMDESALNEMQYELAFTNTEIKYVFRKMIRGWFSSKRYEYHAFLKALLTDHIDEMNFYMNKVTLAVFSSFDVGKQPSKKSEPERFYHGFVLGLIVEMADKYCITSNRESGLGRYDVMLMPLDHSYDGIIIEFKAADARYENSLQETAALALQQIIDKKYAEALEAEGVLKERIRIYGFAFSGKKVLIDGGYLEKLPVTKEL